MRIHPYGPFFPMAQGVRQQFVPPDAFADQFRAAISSNVREYRSHRALLDLPRLKYALGFDGYHVDLDGFILSIYPNLVERPTIGGGSRFEVYFDVTVEVVTPATRDHPAEADERTVCTGDHILDALAAARTILRIEQVREKIREDAMCRTDAQVKASRSNGRKGGRPATIDTAPLLDAIRAAGENCPSTELRNRFPSEWRKAQTAGEIATWREGAEFFVRLVAR